MLKSLVLTFMLCPIVMSAQTAKVQVLTPAEAAEAKSLYQQKSDLDKKIADFRDSLVKEYIEQPSKGSSGISGVWIGDAQGHAVFNGYNFRSGWTSDDFLFSDDFKYIVPAPVVLSPSASGSICIGGNCGFTTTPAYLNGGVFTND